MPLLYSTPVSLYRDAINAEIQRLFSVGIIPEDFFSDIFDKVGIVQASAGYEEALGSWSFTTTIEIDGELSLALPGLNFCKVLIGADPESSSNNLVLNMVVHYVDGVLSLALLDTDVILEVTGPGFFQALVEDAEGTYTLDSTMYRPSETTPIRFYSEKGFEFYFDSNGQISISEPEGWSFSPFCIPALGIGFDINNMLLRLSMGNDLPETLSDLGYDTDWIGLYCESFQVFFAEGSLLGGIIDDLTFENLALGRGGFSGKISGGPWSPVLNNAGDEFEPGYGVTELFGIPLGVQSVAIEFKENSFVSSSITAQMILPFFDVALDVEIGFTNHGDFTVALGAADGLLELQKPDIIIIEVSSLEFVKEGAEFLFRLSGKVTPLLANLAWPSFELKGLTIGSDGTVRVEGGWIELPDQKALDFHGFQIEIAQLGFGSDEIDGDLYKWVGFSGGIQIIQALPLRGGVEGLKVMWTEGDKFKLKIGGVYLSFEIQDVLTFEGSVYFIDEENPEIKEFRGGVDLNLIPLNLGINAQFITGKTSDYNYFYIAVGLDLPIGIPLGPPVLGLYGLAGLYGHNMTLDYQDLINYEDVANRPDLTDASPEGEWIRQKDAMAFGAGLTVGTLPDAKFIVKAKALFVILIPGPVLLIEGYAGMLSVSENFLLRVLAVLDPAAGTFLMNITASYQYAKEEGNLLNIAGSAEAYFSAADPSSWHLYLGEDQPEAKRIRADILNLFKAQTYLMIDHGGLLMGAWIGYSLDKKYGILRVILEAWMGGELGISTMPFQAKGSITLYGRAELSASIVSLGISVEANVTAEAPKPLYISASLEVQLKTPLGKPKAKIKLKWEEPGVPAYPVPLSTTLGVEHRKVSKNWEIPKYSPYVVDADGLFTGVEVPVAIPKVPVVPPDVYLVLSFDKPVIDSDMIGANPHEITGYETVGDYEFKYELKSVTLEYREAWDENVDDDVWEDYVTQNSDYTLTGNWQFIPNTDDIANTKLILNASTPFEISRLLEEDDLWYTLLNVYNPDYPCYSETELEEICADFENRDIGTYYATLVQDGFIFTSPFPMVVHGYVAPWLGTEKALNNTDGYQTIECLNIKAQEPTEAINLKVINEVLITAGVGYDSYLKFTDEYSEADIELYINQSSLDLANGIIPVFIHFPKVSFGETPYKVWITCIVGDPSDFLFYAFDDEGDVIDKVKLNEGRNVNGAVVYELEADVPIRKIGLLGYGFRIIDICWPVHHRVENSSILVTLPEEVVQAEVHLSKHSQGTVYLYDKENTEIQQIAFDIPEDIPDEEVQPVMLSIGTQPFQSFLILGLFDIIRVCGVTQEAQETYDYNAGLSTHLQTTLEENWGKHTAQILEPNKYYRLKIETATSRRKNGGAWEEQLFTENMYFKTGNPPGPPASTQTEMGDNVADRYDLEGPLMNLSAYIEYTIPAGAAADEAQSYIYRSYDIGMVYNDSYVEQMYHMADLPVKIRLLDNNNLPVLNAAGEVVELVNEWGDNPELSLSREESHYEDILNDSGCVIMTGVTAETSTSLLASSRDLLLKPQIQYRAQVVAGEMVVHEFAFLSSRYANFRHHIHSFADTLWDHFALSGDADYQTNTHVLEQILNNTEKESVQFEQLMAFFDLIPRPLPARTEITLLNDKDRSYGLLLESPEPLDKERCTMTMAFADKNEPVIWSDSVVKIVGGSADGIANHLRIVQGDYNHQWIDVFLLESLDLSGYTLEYRAVSAEEEEDYQTYYTFESGSFFNAGTLVSIYNGEAPDPALLPTETVQLYASHLTDLASPEGLTFLLKDPQGEILYTFTLYKSTAFEEVNPTIIRNEDGTRLFIFIPEETLPHSTLKEGMYQCTFTYQRDIGSGQPMLRRFGSSADEEAIIRFALPIVPA